MCMNTLNSHLKRFSSKRLLHFDWSKIITSTGSIKSIQTHIQYEAHKQIVCSWLYSNLSLFLIHSKNNCEFFQLVWGFNTMLNQHHHHPIYLHKEVRCIYINLQNGCHYQLWLVRIYMRNQQCNTRADRKTINISHPDVDARTPQGKCTNIDTFSIPKIIKLKGKQRKNNIPNNCEYDNGQKKKKIMRNFD